MGRLGAIVLAGGRSTRFGSDKALAILDGESLVERVVRAASVHAIEVLVVCGHDSVLPVLPPHVRVVRDALPYEGPLAAVAQGCACLSPDVARVFVAATDLPWLAPALVRRLAELAVGRDAAIPVVDGAPQPLCALYSRAACERAAGLVSTGSRSMRALMSAIDARLVTREELLADAEVLATDPRLRSLLDVDTRSELDHHCP